MVRPTEWQPIPVALSGLLVFVVSVWLPSPYSAIGMVFGGLLAVAAPLFPRSFWKTPVGFNTLPATDEPVRRKPNGVMLLLSTVALVVGGRLHPPYSTILTVAGILLVIAAFMAPTRGGRA